MLLVSLKMNAKQYWEDRDRATQSRSYFSVANFTLKNQCRISRHLLLFSALNDIEML